MTKQHEPLVIELPDPIVCWLDLPDRAGTVRGEITTVEVRHGGDAWLRIRMPMWQRWATQVRVGQPSKDGLAPGAMDVWAPPDVVQTDEDDHDSLRDLVRERVAQSSD